MREPERSPERRRPSRWPERLTLALAALLLLAGLLTIPLRRLVNDPRRAGVTGEVLPGLQKAGRIEAEPGALRGHSVLLLTTDTTRADHLGALGNESVETPVLDGLAREGILCASAITPSPSTLPAHTSLLTGLYPVHHGARANGNFRVEERVTTLAERLRARGYRTGAVVSAFVLDSRFGLDQGFELYHDDLTRGVQRSPHMFRERPAELSNEPALAFLRDHAGEPFFLWVHYFDPHASYAPPEPFRSRYADDLYDGEIAYADAQIGVLLAELAALGARERTLVVYAADHGEGLGEHGEETHSLLTYDATLRVPLLFHAPEGLPRGVFLRRETSLVDVVPTVLELLGEELPAGLDGVSLLHPEDSPRTLYFETISTMTLHGWAPLLGVRRRGHKYILAPSPELYDLRRDPGELENRLEAEPALAEELHQELLAIAGPDPVAAAQVAANLELDDEARRQLAALGYLQTAPEGPDRAAQLALDPKHMVPHWERVQRAINLQSLGRLSEALPELEAAVADVPGDVFTRGILAGTYAMQGEYDKALELHRGNALLDPKSESPPLGIAGIHLLKGELAEAEAEIRRALELEPESSTAQILLGRLAVARRDEEEALARFRRAIEIDPGSAGPSAWNNIGYLHLLAHRLADARAAFGEAIAIDALNGGAHDGLANVLIAEDRREEAKDELALALRFDPNQPLALATLASLVSEEGDQERALALCRKALELSPRLPQAHNSIGLVYRRRGDFERAEESYRKAIELGPHFDAPHVNLAQLYLRQGRAAEGIAEFEAAVRANPYSRIALANLGAHFYNQGQVEKALGFYLAALRVDPDYALVHKNIGSIYLERARPIRAAWHLRRALELDPEIPEAEAVRFALAEAERAAAANGGP
jgi:arylsulfatase A-like enzyme/Flp pilus assembly protein TadD